MSRGLLVAMEAVSKTAALAAHEFKNFYLSRIEQVSSPAPHLLILQAC